MIQSDAPVLHFFSIIFKIFFYIPARIIQDQNDLRIILSIDENKKVVTISARLISPY